jgi:hypothetical protein
MMHNQFKAKLSFRLIKNQVKLKLSLCVINKEPGNENVQGSGNIAASFLTSALVGGEW